MLAQRTMAGKKTYDSFTKSLLHFNGNYVDEIGKIWTPNASVLSATSKFGSGSVQFNGSSWIDTPDHADFTLGSGDFTVDFGIYRSTTGTIQRICGQMDSANTAAQIAWQIYIDSGNAVTFQVRPGGSAYEVVATGLVLGASTWYHIAGVKEGTNIKLYVDGVLKGTTAVPTTAISDSTAKVAIGRCGEYATEYYNGYVDEFRFSKGIARWTADFTPPTAEY
jgi:hypothetical protein